MPSKVMILGQFDHGYYIRGTLKRLTDVVAWFKAWWIRMLWPASGLGGSVEEMPAKVMILAQFGHEYYIRGTLKRLTDVVASLRTWWIHRLTDVVAWFKAWWICLKAWWIRTRNPCHSCLTGEEMPAKVMILAQFDHGYYIRGTLKRLTDVMACSRLGGSIEEMPAKVMILAQFGHEYYIRGTLKRLTDVVASLRTWWIHFDHGYYIRGTLKRLTDVVAWFKAWWIRTGNLCHSCLAAEEMPAKVMILAQSGHGYYIRGTLKRLTDVVACLRAWWICLKAWWICTRNPCHSCLTGEEMPAKVMIWAWWIRYCLAGEEMPTKVMILAQFDHGYYIRGTLKRLMGALAWLKAWWICFDHRYYIRGTLKRLTDVVAWFKAWWICVSVKQVTDQKSMPLLPRWGGKVVILAQFGHRYYIRGTLK
ncbi:hypothetical protein C8R44DRAFT_729116 [Mycena epipterygia]|nr:hypothetical protein C8R44DRAFT_729116 [Mycena epipterygia]